MGMLDQVTVKPTLKPPRIVIHGRGGVGKTTFGASAKSPIVLPCEEGLGVLEVPHFPTPQDYGDVASALEELRKGEHSYSSLVVDTIDHLEPLVWQKICQDRSTSSKSYKHIEDFGYGKGYAYADPVWTGFFHALDALRRERSMTMIVLCHNEMKTVDDPAIGPYTRVEPKLHKRANALMYEWADIVGYLDTERTPVEKEGSKGRSTLTSQATGRRMLRLEDMGGFVAKNRMSLPAALSIPKENGFSVLRDAVMKAFQKEDN